MKNKTHPNLAIRSSLALALALTICAPVPAQSAEPAAEKTTMADKMAEHGQAMKEQKMNKNGVITNGYVQDIESLAIKNDDFRRVLYTAKNCQLTSSFASRRVPVR
jgi:flagellar biosynthesis protein FliP